MPTDQTTRWTAPPGLVQGLTPEIHWPCGGEGHVHMIPCEPCHGLGKVLPVACVVLPVVPQPVEGAIIKWMEGEFVFIHPCIDVEDRYGAGDNGVIYRIDKGAPLPLAPWKDGYRKHYEYIKIDDKNRRVHEMIASAFYGPSPGVMECRHIDGDHSNNRPENLDWGTKQQNGLDRSHHGRDVGHERSSAKLTAEDVRKIRTRWASQQVMADKYKVHHRTIENVLSGKSYGKRPAVPRNFPAYERPRNPLGRAGGVCEVMERIEKPKQFRHDPIIKHYETATTSWAKTLCRLKVKSVKAMRSVYAVQEIEEMKSVAGNTMYQIFVDDWDPDGWVFVNKVKLEPTTRARSTA